MRSRRDGRAATAHTRPHVVVAVIVALAFATSNVAAVVRQPTPSSAARTADRAPSVADVDRALQQVEADPNLGGTHKSRQLQWKRGEDKPRKSSPTPAWLRWIGEFFSWIGNAGRVFVWVLGAMALTALLLWLRRIAAARAAGSAGRIDELPSHIQALDIRPESLPADIGASARGLWDRGEHRAALSLLYRGALSRLVHVWAVPVRASSTEGECVDLAAQHLTGRADTSRSFARLVDAWQRAVYGARLPETTLVHELCTGFPAAFDAPPLAEPAR